MTLLRSRERDREKRAAASRAVAKVEDGMVPGLGSGSTAAFAVKAVAARIAMGLRVVAIPSSETTAALARQFDVPLTSFAKYRRIDVTIDGADQVQRGTFNLIKGLGGALLRENILASASDRMIIVDETKLVDRLDRNTAPPVETTLHRLSAIGCEPRLRMTGDKPFTTDTGNHIVDCSVAEIPDPSAPEARLCAIIGVVESGLFVGLASKVVRRSAGRS